MKTYLFVLFLGLCLPMSGQVYFDVISARDEMGNTLNSIVPIAIADIDGDTRDDILTIHNGKTLVSLAQLPQKDTFSAQTHFNVSNNAIYSMATGDLNNDGVAEVVVNDGTRGANVFKRNAQGVFMRQTMPNLPIYAQTTNFADLNNDGFLDLFVCNDLGESITYLNDGTGQLQQEKLIDFQKSATDDMSGNYGSVWFDIDEDGDQDLYIAKCRAGVTDPADPRRVNSLYINNGDSTFTESAEAYGLAMGEQSWSLDIADVNNDGLIDILVANHGPSPHELMINNGNGTFSAFPYSANKFQSSNIQSILEDFDNNGYVDMLFCHLGSMEFFLNDGMTFTQHKVLLNNRSPQSISVGDLNDDGRIDIYSSFALNYFQPNLGWADEIWMNRTGNGNFVKFHLEGTESNIDGIGAKVEIYGNFGVQARVVTAGMSYGISKSNTIHFGLGDAQEVDSVKVIWPSGNIDVHAGVAINTTNFVKEGTCISPRAQVADQYFCDGESEVEMILPGLPSSTSWSHGHIGSSAVLATGTYNFAYSENGCLTFSEDFEVLQQQPTKRDEVLTTSLSTIACGGDSLTVVAGIEATNYLWSNGDTSTTTQIAPGDSVFLEIETACDIQQSEVIFAVEGQQPIEAIGDTIRRGEVAVLRSSSDSTHWYREPRFNSELLHVGRIFEWTGLEDTTVAYAIANPSERILMRQAEVGLATDLATAVATSSNVTNRLVFPRPIMVHEFQLVGAATGRVRVQLLRVDGTSIFEQYVDVSASTETVTVDKELQPGIVVFTLQTVDQDDSEIDEPLPLMVAGSAEERHRFRELVYLPKSDNYTFNWEVSYFLNLCLDWVEVPVLVSGSLSSSDFVKGDYLAVPNPSNGEFLIEGLETKDQVQVFDARGRKVANWTREGDRFSVTKSGLYLVQVWNSKKVETLRVLVL